MKNYKHIIWDWNGTLFDDVNLCVETINWLLTKYNLPTITLEKYRDIFSFPVRNYYEKAGFDLKIYDFNAIGKEWMDEYERRKSEIIISDGTISIIKKLNKKGIEQSILSAYSENTLIQLVEGFGIRKYFKHVIGLDNIYAESKLDPARRLFEKLSRYSNFGIKNQILLIGDTEHDFEIANEFGIDCILLTTGHQSPARLRKCNVPVFDSLQEVYEYLIQD